MVTPKTHTGSGIELSSRIVAVLLYCCVAACCVLFATKANGQLVDPLQPGQANLDAPAQREPNERDQKRNEAGLAADARISQLFGEVDQVDLLPLSRKNLARTPAVDAVFAAEAIGRKTADVGDLLNQSKAAHGVSVQNRTPIISDTRIRGQRVGQVLASGSYWAPARMDLDTMMNKIDSRQIEDAILIKGPYAARYGPGFRFVDLEFVQSPRHANGFEAHGSTSATFNTNGDRWAGRQTVLGGNKDYGFHISYGHQTGNDYETGQDGFSLPTSYKSRDLFAAFGFDLSAHQTIEFNVLRLDQTDVEFPGLVFDLNFLVTDGYEVTYKNTQAAFADTFVAEVWYNRTRFEGDTLRSGKNRQIPSLQSSLTPDANGFGFGVTDGDALSGGYRLENQYKTLNGRLSIGTDMILLNQELNDLEPASPPIDANFPIPRSYSVDFGVFLEDVEQLTDRFSVTMGLRADAIVTDSRDVVDGVSYAAEKFTELEQNFALFSGYLTGEYQLRPGWTIDAGLGTAQRPPTLTEMYASNSFIGSLQRGLTFLTGDPELKPERLFQVDLGTNYQGNDFQFGLHGHHAWIQDFITYDAFDPAGNIDGFQSGAVLTNTDLATLDGFETYGQYDASRMLSFFGSLSYVKGTDRTRNKAARLTFIDNRSEQANVPKEALPGISPLESRLGILVQDPSAHRRWGVEFLARIVDDQSRVAATLDERKTPGFTTYNVRTYRRFDAWLVTAGVENLTDKFYREHIDYRSGLGVFRPGINFYVGAEVTY
ncbi:MAG: TonB-dependent receptor [Rubripirellula sp.]